MHVYSEERFIEVNGAYAPATVDRIAALGTHWEVPGSNLHLP